MKTLTIHSISPEQEKAIRIFLDALHVEYKVNDDADNTTYLLSLSTDPEQSKKPIQKNKVMAHNPDDIWRL
jgi:hypothetical protein